MSDEPHYLRLQELEMLLCNLAANMTLDGAPEHYRTDLYHVLLLLHTVPAPDTMPPPGVVVARVELQERSLPALNRFLTISMGLTGGEGYHDLRAAHNAVYSTIRTALDALAEEATAVPEPQAQEHPGVAVALFELGQLRQGMSGVEINVDRANHALISGYLDEMRGCIDRAQAALNHEQVTP